MSLFICLKECIPHLSNKMYKATFVVLIIILGYKQNKCCEMPSSQQLYLISIMESCCLYVFGFYDWPDKQKIEIVIRKLEGNGGKGVTSWPENKKGPVQ